MNNKPSAHAHKRAHTHTHTRTHSHNNKKHIFNRRHKLLSFTHAQQPKIKKNDSNKQKLIKLFALVNEYQTTQNTTPASRWFVCVVYMLFSFFRLSLIFTFNDSYCCCRLSRWLLCMQVFHQRKWSSFRHRRRQPKQIRWETIRTHTHTKKERATKKI